MAEYKLSYTANEIDEKLGKIDNLVATINGVAPDENGNVIVQGGGGVTSWNDLKDRPFSEEAVVVIPEQTLTGFEMMSDAVCAVVNPFDFSFCAGNEYIVTWDGSEYACVATSIDAGMVYLGNLNYVMMQSGGDIPFALIKAGDLFVATETMGSHTITIKEIGIQKIDPKYIKDMYGSDLTEVVSGKITNINWNENYWDGASYAVYSDGIREYLSGLRDAGYEYYESFHAAQLTVNGTTRWMLTSEGCNIGVENGFDGENYCTGLWISPWGGIYLENGEVGCAPIPPDIVSVFGVMSPEEVYEIGFTIYRGTFNRIDEKYIPDSIARSNDIWATAVSVVDEAMDSVTSDIEEINNALADKQDRLDTVNIKWTTSTLPANDYWSDIAYGNGRFVAVAQLSSRVAVSTDGGITWIESSMPEKGSYISIAYGNGVFVAMDGLADKAALSTDGITWSEVLLPEQCSHGQIAYGNGMFVTMDSYSDKVSYSTDGITWNESTLPGSPAWSRIAYGNGMFVITTSVNFDDVAYSTDGITWFRSELPETGWWNSLAYGNGVFVTFNSLSNSTTAAYSTDGVVWTRTTLPESQSWASIAYGNGMFVATPKDSNKVAYSTDGITWHMSTLPESRDWISIAYGDNTFIAVTDQQSYSNGLAARFKPLELFAAKVDKDVIRGIIGDMISPDTIARVGDSPILTSPSGKKFQLTVDDSGTLSAAEVTE